MLCYSKSELRQISKKKKTKSHLWILDAIPVTCSKVHTVDPLILCAEVQNETAKETWRPGFVYPSSKCLLTCPVFLLDSGSAFSKSNISSPMYVIKINFLHMEHNNSVTFWMFSLLRVQNLSQITVRQVYFCVKSNLKIVSKHSRNFIG